MKLKKTMVAIAIHRDDESPIYGENTTVVSLDDEGTGQFVTIRQTAQLHSAEIRLDPGEVPIVLDAAQKLLGEN